eukprot:5873221-Prymnesium_polylepis.1
MMNVRAACSCHEQGVTASPPKFQSLRGSKSTCQCRVSVYVDSLVAKHGCDPPNISGYRHPFWGMRRGGWNREASRSDGSVPRGIRDVVGGVTRCFKPLVGVLEHLEHRKSTFWDDGLP